MSQHRPPTAHGPRRCSHTHRALSTGGWVRSYAAPIPRHSTECTLPASGFCGCRCATFLPVPKPAPRLLLPPGQVGA